MPILNDLNDGNGIIPNNQRADVMRCSIENKNLLNSKGSIYVGTGESHTIYNGGGEGVDINIPITTALPVGPDGSLLICDNSSNAGLSYINKSDLSVGYSNIANFSSGLSIINNSSIQNVSSIEIVSVLPLNPDSNTLYLIRSL